MVKKTSITKECPTTSHVQVRLSQYRSVAICLFASLMLTTGMLQVLVGYIVIHYCLTFYFQFLIFF